MPKLYTKTGDKGRTDLPGGSRVPKDHPRVRACGAVDELNACIGLCRAVCSDDELASKTGQVQSELFVLGGDLAAPEPAPHSPPRIEHEHVRRLETWIDQASAAAPPLAAFVLPAGCELACRLHLARTVCRRAEREVVSLTQADTVNEFALVYLNRLSDLLFACARLANHQAGATETTWTPHLP